MEDFKDRVAIITGASMGIGRAVALRLATEGSDIVIADMEEKGGLETVAEVEKIGRKAIFFRVNVSDREQVAALVNKTMETFQRVDFLVCCAGITGQLSSPAYEYDLMEWDRVIAVNLTGTFLCCREVLPQMVKQGFGKIITISSMAAKDGNPGMCAYVASKGGIVAFSKGLAKEVVKDGVAVHCIAPTVIESRFLELMGPEVQKTLLEKIPMGRFGKPEEVASLVKYLVSSECSFSTGFCHDLSGGRAVY